jgi:hypothetical protein
MEDNPVPLTLSSALQSLSVTNPDSPSPSHHEHHSASPNPRPPSSQSKPLHVNSLPPPIENPNPTTEAPDVVMTNPGGEESAVAMEVDNVDASQSSAENNPQQPSPASSTSPIHADATPATATTTAASSENKPKGKGKPRTKPAAPPTPPAEPAAPPPRPTVRLNIPLGGPTNYSVSILELARDTGQRPPTPPPVRRDSVSGSDDDSEPDEDANTNEGKKKKNTGLSTRKRAKLAKEKAEAAEYYDLDDPFIDDSDLGVDAPTHFAQTKQKGFYVSSGEVQLVKDEYVFSFILHAYFIHLISFLPQSQSSRQSCRWYQEKASSSPSTIKHESIPPRIQINLSFKTQIQFISRTSRSRTRRRFQLYRTVRRKSNSHS